MTKHQRGSRLIGGMDVNKRTSVRTVDLEDRHAGDTGSPADDALEGARECGFRAAAEPVRQPGDCGTFLPARQGAAVSDKYGCGRRRGVAPSGAVRRDKASFETSS
jgi:hypothetical protein